MGSNFHHGTVGAFGAAYSPSPSLGIPSGARILGVLGPPWGGGVALQGLPGQHGQGGAGL